MSSVDFKKIKDLPPMPKIAQMVLEIMEDPDFSFAELVRVISKDANIAVSILKLANSAFYSPKSKIVNLTQALSFLGANTVKNLVVSLSTKYLFAKNKFTLLDQKIWQHSVATAMLSRILMLKIDKKMVEEAFLLGLMHDIGISVMKMNIDSYEDFLQYVYNENLLLYKEEVERFNLSHAYVGAKLLEYWKMAEVYSDVVLNHHSPDLSKYEKLANVIFYANSYINSINIGISRDNEDVKTAYKLGLEADELEDTKLIFMEVYKKEKELFGI